MVAVMLKVRDIPLFSTNYNHTCTNVEQIFAVYHDNQPFFMNKLAAEHTIHSRAFWVFSLIDAHLILPQTMVKASLAQQVLKARLEAMSHLAVPKGGCFKPSDHCHWWRPTAQSAAGWAIMAEPTTVVHRRTDSSAQHLCRLACCCAACITRFILLTGCLCIELRRKGWKKAVAGWVTAALPPLQSKILFYIIYLFFYFLPMIKLLHDLIFKHLLNVSPHQGVMLTLTRSDWMYFKRKKNPKKLFFRSCIFIYWGRDNLQIKTDADSLENSTTRV